MFNRRFGIAALAGLPVFARANSALLTVCLVGFVNALATGLVNPIMALYAREYSPTTALVGVFMTTFALGRLFVAIPTGRWTDRVGGKRLMVIGAIIEALSAFWLAAAQSYPSMVAARLMEGVGAGLFTFAAMIVVAQLARPSERGRFTSLFQGSQLLGLTITPALGGALATAYGLRAPLIAYGLVEAVVFFLVVWRIPYLRPRSTPPEVSPPAPSPAPEPDALTSVPVPAPGPVSNPVSTRALLRNRNFVLVAMAAFLVFVGRSGARDTLLPIYGTGIAGLTTTEIGVTFTLIALANFLTIPLAGVLSDAVGRKLPILIGLGLSGVALLLLSAGVSGGLFVGAALLLGAAKGFGEPTTVIYVTDIAPAAQTGAAFGLFLTLRDLGLFSGPVVLSSLTDLAGIQFAYLTNAAAFIIVAVLFAFIAQESYARARLRPKPARQ